MGVVIISRRGRGGEGGGFTNFGFAKVVHNFGRLFFGSA